VIKDLIIQNINSLKSHFSISYGIKTKTEAFTEKLFYTLFDANAPLNESIDALEKQFKEISAIACQKPHALCDSIWEKYLEKLPSVLENLNQDAAYILENDPASNSIEEVYLAYPGFYAIAIYRLSHELYLLDLLLFSRLMSEYAHRITGTDIHAGATIRRNHNYWQKQYCWRKCMGYKINSSQFNCNQYHHHRSKSKREKLA
jgi:serine O-acetyltransferase